MRIHLVTPIVTEGIRTLDDVADLNGNGLSITQSLIAAGPASIECEFDEAMAVPGIVAEAIAAERSGADAGIIDCMGDPGLKAAREDRKRVGEGKSVEVRVDTGGGRVIKKKKKQ